MKVIGKLRFFDTDFKDETTHVTNRHKHFRVSGVDSCGRVIYAHKLLGPVEQKLACYDKTFCLGRNRR